MSDFIVLIQSIERRYNIGLKQNKTNKTFTCEMCTHMQNRQMQSSLKKIRWGHCKLWLFKLSCHFQIWLKHWAHLAAKHLSTYKHI